MKILKLITFFTIFLSQGTFANLIVRIDDPDSSSYIQMIIQGADFNDYIFNDVSPTYILPGDFSYFDGVSINNSNSFMFNESSFYPMDDYGAIDLRGEYFENSIGFSTSGISAYETWASLSGQSIYGHNYYTYLSSQPYEIKMNAGQPDPSSSAWVISVDPTVVPLPAAAWLFGASLTGLGLVRRR